MQFIRVPVGLSLGSLLFALPSNAKDPECALTGSAARPGENFIHSY